MQDTLLDQIVTRLQNMNAFDVHAVHADGTVKPWYAVTGLIVKDLVIDELRLAQQVQAVAAQIAHWGRLSAQAKRVWEIEERAYRVWRSRQVLALIEPPVNPEAAKGWKKPTEAVLEATYRCDPEYASYQTRIERAEEAYLSAQAIQDGFRAQRDMLMRYAQRNRDENAPHLSV